MVFCTLLDIILSTFFVRKLFLDNNRCDLITVTRKSLSEVIPIELIILWQNIENYPKIITSYYLNIGVTFV